MTELPHRVTQALEAARAALEAVGSLQPDSVAAAGAILEELVESLPQDLPRLPLLLSLVLEVLQRLYEGETEAPEMELAVARRVLASVEQPDSDECEAAGAELWAMLGRDPDLSPFEAPNASSPQTLDDLLALLIGLNADDEEGLSAAQQALLRLSQTEPWPAAAVALAREAATSSLPDALAIMGSLVELLAEAETSEDDNRTPASPAPEDPVCLEFQGDMTLLAEFVSESLEHLQTAESALLELEQSPSDREAINTVFRGFHTVKGTAGFLGLPSIQKLAHHAEALLDRARSGEVSVVGPVADQTLRAVDMLKMMVAKLRELGPEGLPPPPAGLEELLDALSCVGTAAGECPAATLTTSTSAPVSEAGRAEREAKSSGRRRDDLDSAEVVRIRTDRLDLLINMIGELVIANAMLLQDEVAQRHQSEDLGRKVGQVNKITRELQAVSTAMRTVPLKNTFQKMARVVRDLAHKSGKQVQFVSEGDDTEIDRTMVEALGDPLLHMVRNAVDHGLEDSLDRLAAGKDEVGIVTLRAYHAAGRVVIELQDNGRGLNREKILRKAIAAGVVEEGRELSDNDVYRLVFTPGLSTAEQVTAVSGRGVGMDVVARNIEALHGRVDITSTPGQGTTFSISVPLTLAIMDGMLVRVGLQRYIIPTVSIQQAFRARYDEVKTIAEQGEMALFRGDLVPIVRLHRLFKITNAQQEISEALLVVIEQDAGRYALLVDELLGQQQIVIKSLGNGLQTVPGVSGSAILSDGRVGLILDVSGLLKLMRSVVAEACLPAVC